MNLLAANGIDSLFNNIFADWTIALFIFFAALILLSILFKGLKVGAVLIAVAAVISGAIVLAAFVYSLISSDILQIIDSVIKWGPTVLFVIIILISTLVNAKRGLRKSLILLIQAVVACIICVIFFYVCVTSAEVDKLILGIVNQMLGGSTLQSMLGVSENCSTIREIIAEWLPNVVGGDIKILLAANPEYIVTLVDMVFRIVFSVITSILYLFLVFFFYLIYFFAYPERRYKKKIKRKLEKNQTDRPYKKHHAGGGAVGLVRGVTVGLLTLSFLGSGLYMVAGGLGQGALGDYDLDNDEYNFYYSIYRSVDSYGSQGIFKVLNSMTDSSDTPFYLFAADMVLSGNLDDEDNGIDGQTVKFREEIAAFTGFAKDAFNLLMKYGEEDMVDIINGRGGSDAFNKIVNIMTVPEFRTEFDMLLEEFKTPTYVINLGMSLINTVVDKMDDISFTASIGEDNKELLKLLFKKDYLTDTIPDEAELKQQLEAGTISPGEISRPRLSVNHLLTKDDIRIALEIAFSFLAGEQDTNDPLGLVKSLLPEVRQLSIFQTKRSNELDPVLSRLYCYFGNKYLTAEGEEGITYSSVAGRNIKWLNELNTLFDVAGDALTLWGNIYRQGASPVDMLVSLFDKNDVNYEENSRCFDGIRSALERSGIIGTVMSSSFIKKMLTDALTAVSASIYIPKDIEYTSKVEPDGTVVVEGELHKLFSGFMLLTSAKDGEFLNEILSMASGGTVDLGSILSALSDALSSVDKDGKNLSYYLTESQLLRSLISAVMMDKGADIIYIPDVALEKLENGESVNLIIKSELKSLFDHLAPLIELVEPILNGDSSDYLSIIGEYLNSGELFELLEANRIVEGTVAKMLVKYITDNEFIVVPAALSDNIDGWVTVNGKKGEMRKMLDAIQALELDFEGIAGGDFNMQELFDSVLSLDEAAVDTMLSSQVLYYTLSKYIIDGTETGGFKIIVPNGARVPTAPDEVIPYTVSNKELKTLFEIVAAFDIFGSEELDIASVLYKLVVNVDKLENSRIMSATIVYTIVSNDQIKNTVSLPETYIRAGSEEALLDYNSSNPWSTELKKFINALDEILGIGTGDEFVLDGESLQESLSVFLTQLNKSSRVNPEKTKLALCYDSVIIKSEITARLDDTLIGNNIVPEDVVKSIKYNGYYTEEEIQALANTLDIFGIDDLLGINGADMIAKVKETVFGLNDPLEDYEGRTGLEVMYCSNIIKYIFSSQLDGVLSGMLDDEVINQIKVGSDYYPVADIAAFIDAAREIEIADFDGMSDFDFSKIEGLTETSHLFPESGKSRLVVIYDSRIAAGIITKGLYSALNSSDSGVAIDHPKAYREDLKKTYKLTEIESLLNIFGNLEDFDINTVDLNAISSILYDDNGETHSWLIASAISKIFVDNDRFIIPVDIVEDGCINPGETALIISVFSDLSDGKSIEDLEGWEITEIPSGETRQKLFSSEIMRARVTFDMGEESLSGDPVYVSASRVKNTRDTNGIARLVILEEELTALADAIDVMGGSGGSAFAIPGFSFEQLANYDETALNAMLDSDILYYKVCECLLQIRDTDDDAKEFLEGKTEFIKAISLSEGGEGENKEVIPRDTVKLFIPFYKLVQQYS